MYFVFVSILCINTSQMYHSYLMHDRTAVVARPCLGQLFCYYVVERMNCFMADLNRLRCLRIIVI